MNKNQYSALSWSFFVFGFILIYFHLITPVPFGGIEGSTSPYHTYLAVKSALLFAMIFISYFLGVVFQIIGWLEPKEK